MTESTLSATILELWPRFPEDQLEPLWRVVKRVPIDDEQARAALEAEWGRPANKTPVHERIIRALKAAVPVTTADSRPSDLTDDAKFFRSLRLAGGYPVDWSDAAVVRQMHASIAARAARLGGSSDGAIKDAERDFERFTTLDHLDIRVELEAIYGPERMAQYEASRAALRERMVERRVTERDIVKTARFQGADVEDRLEQIRGIVDGGGARR